MSRIHTAVLITLSIIAVSILGIAETFPAANQDPAYKNLRVLKPTGESFTLSNVVLKRDAATFTLTGTLCFTPPIEGKVTGAVFSGNGTFSMEPPLRVEKMSISRLTKEPRINEDFEHLVLRFTDATYEELVKSPGVQKASGGCSGDGYWNDIDNALHHDNQIKWDWNLTARVLQDVYSGNPDGLFVAFIKGKKYSGKELFIVDPHGAPSVSPEEISFATWSEDKSGIWAAFHYSSEYGKPMNAERNSVVNIQKQQVDLTVEKNAHLRGITKTTFTARQDGIRVVPFELYSTLRVEYVTSEDDKKLDFIQEDKEQDPQFWIVLPAKLKRGEQFTVITKYAGKDALLNEGGGNYYLAGGARHSWYPGTGFDGSYAQFDMRFTYPKGYKLVASGVLDKETTEGSQIIAHWTTPEPQTVAAFQFGQFKRDEKQLSNLLLQTYANDDLPDYLKSLQSRVDQLEQSGYRPEVTLGSMNTTSMMKRAMSEAEAASQIYTNYFGPSPFKTLALTQQTADNYGQAWPQLVWLPLSYFLDGTIRHQLYGFDPRGYFTVVAPHEIAHQWWGHTITWASYRDQWMSEGFSDASASIYLQATNKDIKPFLKFWNDEHEMITERNKFGFRAIDVGPLTLGYRLNNAKTGYNITRELIYPKGAYIMHMLRMMMWSQQTGDQNFKATMQDFVATYRNKAASTEDFKAMVEKHMTPAMDLTENRRMDWFFDEYVYGTALPSYRLEQTFDGMKVEFKITQSGVEDNFMMRMPIYLELADGRIARIGSLPMKGNNSVSQKLDLAAMGLKDQPKRLVLNYNYDVLADKVEQK